MSDSVPGEQVVEAAAMLARLVHGELCIVRCNGGTSTLTDVPCCAALDRAADAISEQWSVALPISTEVAAYARGIGAAAVVIGRERARPFHNLRRRGGTPVHQAVPCPVLYLSPSEEGVENLRCCREVVCFVSFHKAAEAIVSKAAEFARLTGAKLTLAHAVAEASEALLTTSLMSDGELQLDPDRVHSRLHALASACGVDATAKVFRGSYRRWFKTLDRSMLDTVLVVGQREGRRSANDDLIISAHLAVLCVPYAR